MSVLGYARAAWLRRAGAVLSLVTLTVGLASAQEKPPAVSSAWPSTPGLLTLYVLGLVALVFGLHIVDSVKAYTFSRESRDRLLEKLHGSLSPEQLTKVAGELTPTGIQGTTRSIFTYALLLVLGIAIFHLLTMSKFEKAPEYADKILTLLSGSLASIIGFYFGSQATKDAAEPARQQAQTPPASPGKITGVVPKQANRSVQVKIEGTGFGDEPGSVKFGLVSAEKPEGWSPTSILVKVPPNAEPGPTTVSVNPVHDKEIVGSPALFTVLPSQGHDIAELPVPHASPAPSSMKKGPDDLASDEGSFVVAGGA